MATQQKKYLNQAGLAHFYARLKDIFIAGEEGMGLSENDFTDELKDRLEELDPDEFMKDEDALTFSEIDDIISDIDRRYDSM